LRLQAANVCGDFIVKKPNDSPKKKVQPALAFLSPPQLEGQASSGLVY
jgi:hypothetical protein